MERIATQKAMTRIADQKNFTNFSESFTGKVIRLMPSNTGLSNSERDLLQQALDDFPYVYTVFSYRTPIAWYTDKWHVNPEKYTVTTAKHKNLVIRAIEYQEKENLISMA